MNLITYFDSFIIFIVNISLLNNKCSLYQTIQRKKSPDYELYIQSWSILMGSRSVRQQIGDSALLRVLVTELIHMDMDA